MYIVNVFKAKMPATATGKSQYSNKNRKLRTKSFKVLAPGLVMFILALESL
jgi:hypothetical protein